MTKMSLTVVTRSADGREEEFDIEEGQVRPGSELDCNLPGVFVVEHDPEFVPHKDEVNRILLLFYKTNTSTIRLLTTFQVVQDTPLPRVEARVLDQQLHLLLKPLHPEGRTCGECLMFDAVAGRDELMKVTHTFDGDLTGHAVLEGVQAMAVLAKTAALNRDNVGYCPPHQQLCADATPACVKYFKPRKR